MKRILILFLMLIGLVGIVTTPTYAQANNITVTTLSSAISNTRATTLVVASASGMTATSNPGSTYYIYIDHEAMKLTAISSTTLTVQRGQLGTSTTTHRSGQYVFFGAAGSSTNSPSTGTVVTGGPFVSSDPYGSCTRTANSTLPLINTSTGLFWNCNGGNWQPQTNIADRVQPALEKVCTVPIGSVAYGSFGTSTTTGATSQYTANIFVPQSMYVTGFTNLNGSAVDTASKKIFILYSANGTLIANTATAGTAATGNDAFQAIAFTSPVLVTGPGYYLVALQDDTADANGIRTIAASTFNGLVAGVTTSVFGTVANPVTAPTTFTADQGPIGCLY